MESVRVRVGLSDILEKWTGEENVERIGPLQGGIGIKGEEIQHFSFSLRI